MNTFRSLHPRLRIDATTGDVLYALAATALPRALTARTNGSPLFCLSVRSAFDLLLEALAFDPGDEVMISGITHPDMVRVIKLHNLIPVGVDVDPETLAPTRDALQRALTSRTRMIVVAHLFGGQINIDDVVLMSRKRNLLLVEDRAQSIRSAEDEGDLRADVTLFSFGFIKTATAFGGALAYVRDPALAYSMQALHEQRPQQQKREYFVKALKGLAALAVTVPVINGFLSTRFPDFITLVRTVPPGDDDAYVRWLRRKPCGGLVSTVKHRLRHFPRERLRQRARVGDELDAALSGDLLRPGIAMTNATHWLFPVTTDAPEDLVAYLQEEGFEATKTTSQIAAVSPDLVIANALMESIVFIPAYPEMSQKERRRLAKCLETFAARDRSGVRL